MGRAGFPTGTLGPVGSARFKKIDNPYRCGVDIGGRGATGPQPTVRVKPHTYQPSKAELEELIALPRPVTPEELGRTIVQPVNVVEED